MTEPETTGGANLVGTVLSDRYRIDTLLGEGGMGAVYAGEHLLMHKRVAIKVLHPGMSQSSEVVQRFEREAMAASRIDHPNVAAATDFGRAPDGSFFMVLEFLDGKSLRDELDRGPLPPLRAVHIAAQVASVLIKAHKLGIVHRDLKPENVMLVERDNDPDFAKVLDFGVAKVPVAELKGKEVPTTQGLTRLGVIYGTPAYMSPEQAMGVEIDTRADIYTLGVMLYEMLCGARPFDADNVVALVVMLITDPPPPLASRMPPGVALPPALDQLIARLLTKERDERVATAVDLYDQLRQIEASLGGSPPSQQIPASRVASPLPPSVAPASLPGESVPSVSTARTTIEQVVVAQTTAGQIAALPEPARPPPPWVGEARQALAEMQKLHAGMPRPLSQIPLAVFPAAGLVLVLALASLVCSGKRDPEASAGAAPSASQAPAGVTEGEIEAASAAGAASLEALAERFPDDARILRALVKLHHEGKRPTEAVKAFARLAKVNPDASSDELLIPVIRAATEGPPEAADVAFSLLEEGLGEVGVGILYAMWTSKKEVNARAQTRAGKSLARPEVKERAGKPLRALLELKTSTSCEGKKAGAQLALEGGDTRAVPLLQALSAKRGCGFAGLQDCWPCLRNGSLLPDAIKAASGRPEPP